MSTLGSKPARGLQACMAEQISPSVKAILSLPFEEATAKLQSPACKLRAFFPVVQRDHSWSIHTFWLGASARVCWALCQGQWNGICFKAWATANWQALCSQLESWKPRMETKVILGRTKVESHLVLFHYEVLKIIHLDHRSLQIILNQCPYASN